VEDVEGELACKTMWSSSVTLQNHVLVLKISKSEIRGSHCLAYHEKIKKGCIQVPRPMKSMAN